MSTDDNAGGSVSGSQSQVPPATQVTAEVDGFTITSASSVAPQTAESVVTAVEAAATDAPDPRGTRSPAADAAADAAAEKPAPEKPAEKPPAKKQTAEERHQEMQARIHAATRELREAERRTTALREEAARLARPPEPTPEAPAKRPRWKDYEARGEDYTKYEEDLATWDETRDQRNQAIVEQRLAEQQATAQAHRDHAAYLARCDESRTKHPDWDETITTNLGDVPQTPFMRTVVQAHPKGADIFYDFAKNPDIARAWVAYDSDPATRPTPPIFSALYESAQPSAMLEHLATHPDEYLRLTRMPPVSALLALGKLETALTGAKNGSPGRPISHAAAPLSHRAGSHMSGGPPPALDALEIEDFVRSENKREGRFSPV